MTNFEISEKDFTYLGLKYRLQTISFRIKNFDKILEISNKWMKEEAKLKISKFQELYPNKLEVLFRDDLQNLGIKV